MASTAAVFLAIAGIVAVGYAAGRVTAATRFPDVALLLLLGLLVGPVNRLLAARGLGSPALAEALDPAVLRELAPLVSGLALVVILFEAGLSMELRLMRKSLGPALRLAIPVFLLTVACITVIGHWVYGMPPLVALALGVALSNVGQTVSSAILRRMRIDEQTRAVGLVEMALYDIVSVPLLVSIFLFAGGSNDTAAWSEGLRGFVRIASLSLVLGAGAGVAWAVALDRLRGHPHSYMLTLAVVLALYALTEALDGAGAVSVLLFGLLVGNRTSLLRRLHRRAPREEPETRVQAFHEEVTFLIRTVFFLFLGVAFTVGLRDQWPVASPLPYFEVLRHRAALFGLGAALVIVALPLARAVAIPLVCGRRHGHLRGLIPVFGHGLGTAVLATLPFVWQEFRPGTAFHAAFAPWQPVFVNLAFLVILFSVLGTSLLVFLADRRTPPPAAPRPARAPEPISARGRQSP